MRAETIQKQAERKLNASAALHRPQGSPLVKPVHWKAVPQFRVPRELTCTANEANQASERITSTGDTLVRYTLMIEPHMTGQTGGQTYWAMS